jgi:HemY protein
MRRILSILILTALVLAAAWYVAGIAGSVTAEIGDTTVTLSTSVAALALALGFIVLYALLRLLSGLFGLPSVIGRRRAARLRRTGDLAVTRTLIALAAGDTGDARREAQRARKLLGETPQTLLLAAEAGRASGREAEAEDAFRTLAARPDAAFLGYRGLLRQAMEREDWTEAAELARKADAAHPGAAWLRGERGQLAVRMGNWSEALALADADAPKAALAAAAADAEEAAAQGLRLARQAWAEQPGVPTALAYARRLRQTGKEVKAQEVLRGTWARSPHPEIAAFALASEGDPLSRHQAAKRLAQENPENPESHLLLARTALDAGFADEARGHAEAASGVGMNDRRLWARRAVIDEGDPEASRAALHRAAAAAPDPVWRCTACGTPHPEWRAACTHCGRVGTIGWSASMPAAAMPSSGPMIAHAP